VEDRVLAEMVRVTRKVLVLNYHFTSRSPLYLFNSLFRRQFCSPYPLSQAQLVERLSAHKSVRLLAVRRLGWYERSAALVVLAKAA
jgi:hypothetical protein